jgi:hypothetical protein
MGLRVGAEPSAAGSVPNVVETVVRKLAVAALLPRFVHSATDGVPAARSRTSYMRPSRYC